MAISFASTARRGLWLALGFSLAVDFVVACMIALAMDGSSGGFLLLAMWILLAVAAFQCAYGILGFLKRLAWFFLFERRGRIDAIKAEIRSQRVPLLNRFFSDAEQYLMAVSESREHHDAARIWSAAMLGSIAAQRSISWVETMLTLTCLEASLTESTREAGLYADRNSILDADSAESLRDGAPSQAEGCRMRQVPQIAAAVFLLAATSGAASADPIMGRASVIDADTIELHGTRIRLSGIDAPEGSQICTAPATGKPLPCGRQAAFFLADMIEGKTVACTADGTDRYRRILAHCTVGGVDIGSALVRAGWALAFVRYSREYVADEAHARQAEAGLWGMQFVPAWEWRASKRRP